MLTIPRIPDLYVMYEFINNMWSSLIELLTDHTSRRSNPCGGPSAFQTHRCHTRTGTNLARAKRWSSMLLRRRRVHVVSVSTHSDLARNLEEVPATTQFHSIAVVAEGGDMEMPPGASL